MLFEETSKKDILKQMSIEHGLMSASKLVGGIDNYIKVVYNGDLKEFFKNENEVYPYIIKSDPPVMYIDSLVVDSLNLDTYIGEEKLLGDFNFGNKDRMNFKFTARLSPLNQIGRSVPTTLYKVVGTSGSYGFGLSYISKKETLGKKYRLQIFKQIIDRFKLDNFR